MDKTTIMPADTYIVVNHTIMSDNDRFLLTMLYQPIIGFKALALYFSLWATLDTAKVMSVECNHRHLMNMTGFKIEDIIEGRKKLEAIGLLKTSYKSGEINNYIYQIYAPLTANEVLTHPFLSVILYNAVGAKDFEHLIQYYKMPKIDISSFKDITVSFSDVFKTGTAFFKESQEEIKRRETNDIEIKSNLDMDLIISSIPKDLIVSKTFDKTAKKLIDSISYLYNIDTMHMIGLIRNSLNEKGLIDKEKFQLNARNFYTFENSNQLPHLIYDSQPTNLRENLKDGTKRSKMIYTFETLPPYDFLRGKYNGSNPTTRDLKLIESLLIEQELLPGVVNVLIDYVLRINDNKLTKNFIESIAGQWKRLNIKTVEEAMKQAEKEHKGFNTKKVYVSKKVVEENIPKWFNETVDEETLSEEETKKMKDMLSKFS